MANWIPVSNNNIPSYAMIGGREEIRGKIEPLYIGRAFHNGALLPGKVVGSEGICYVPWGGREYEKNDFKVMCETSGYWVECSGDRIPQTAIQVGHTEDSEPLFLGKVRLNNFEMIVGKVQKSKGVCFIPYKGQEIASKDYFVFCKIQ